MLRKVIDLAAVKKQENGATKNVEPKFYKKQLLTSEKYASRRDLLNALLDDNEAYSTVQVDEIIEKFLKGKVK